MTPEAAAAEALLFVTDEPLSTVTLAEALGVDLAAAQEALDSLRSSLDETGSGLALEEVAGGWRLFTHPRHHDLIESFVLSWDTRRLTNPALEVLAIVAYTQPVTRARISAIRGVNSDSVLRSLIEKGLIIPVGCEEGPGNPITYGTARVFLEHFGLASLNDLPPLEDFAPTPATRALIAERLSARGVVVDTAEADSEDSEETEGGAPRSADAASLASPEATVDLTGLTFNFDDE